MTHTKYCSHVVESSAFHGFRSIELMNAVGPFGKMAKYYDPSPETLNPNGNPHTNFPAKYRARAL